MAKPTSDTLREQAAAEDRKRVEACVAEVVHILKEHGVEAVPQITLIGGQIISQVVFRVKA